MIQHIGSVIDRVMKRIGPCSDGFCGALDCPRCYPQPRREVDDEPRDSGRTWEVEAVEWGGAEKKGEL